MVGLGNHCIYSSWRNWQQQRKGGKKKANDEILKRRKEAEDYIMRSGYPEAIKMLMLTRANPANYGQVLAGGMNKGNGTLKKVFSRGFGDRARYIAIIKMIASTKGVDSTPLRRLSYSTDPEIHALADITPGSDSEPGIAKVPIEPLNVYSRPIALEPGVETHFQFTVEDGRKKSINESQELPPNGELLSIKLLGPDKTGQSKLELKTHMHGMIYMRVTLEGGNDSVLPIQDYLIRGPVGFESWTIEHDWKKVTITDFYLHNWPHEQAEQRRDSIDIATHGPVDSHSTMKWSNRVESGVLNQMK